MCEVFKSYEQAGARCEIFGSDVEVAIRVANQAQFRSGGPLRIVQTPTGAELSRGGAVDIGKRQIDRRPAPRSPVMPDFQDAFDALGSTLNFCRWIIGGYEVRGSADAVKVKESQEKASEERMSSSSKESDLQLKKNINDQLDRLVKQLADLEEYR